MYAPVEFPEPAIAFAIEPKSRQDEEKVSAAIHRLLDEDLALCARMAGADRPPEMEGSARAFAELRYRTRESWSRERRVVGKAELTGGKENPRFIVTNIGTGPGEEWAGGLAEFADGQSLYEMFYCARGDMENRIKEQQLDMFADRTSTFAPSVRNPAPLTATT